MELDGFNEAAGVAFEYDGVQHYEFDGFLNKSADDLRYRQECDAWKDVRCREQGVTLVRVKAPRHHGKLREIALAAAMAAAREAGA